MIFIDSFPFTNGRPKATKKSEAHVIFNYANVLVAGRIFTGYEKEFSDLAAFFYVNDRSHNQIRRLSSTKNTKFMQNVSNVVEEISFADSVMPFLQNQLFFQIQCEK